MYVHCTSHTWVGSKEGFFKKWHVGQVGRGHLVHYGCPGCLVRCGCMVTSGHLVHYGCLVRMRPPASDAATG